LLIVKWRCFLSISSRNLRINSCCIALTGQITKSLALFHVFLPISWVLIVPQIQYIYLIQQSIKLQIGKSDFEYLTILRWKWWMGLINCMQPFHVPSFKRRSIYHTDGVDTSDTLIIVPGTRLAQFANIASKLVNFSNG
jgi:hypothetical protein